MESEDGLSRWFLIKEVSNATGLAPQTVRLWEKAGLVNPGRNERGYRFYREADIERLRRVKRLRTVEGLNYAAIRKQLGTYAADPPSGPPENQTKTRWVAALGDRLRSLRIRSCKTLREVAEATGLSVSFVSAVERGVCGASTDSLRLLAKAYGTDLREIVGVDLRQESPVLWGAERSVVRLPSGARFEGLMSVKGFSDLSLLYAPPHTGSEGYHRPQDGGFLYVLSGSLLVRFRKRGTFRLKPGDAIPFSSALPHKWWTEDEPVQAIYVETCANS